jgi:hypothetical protein
MAARGQDGVYGRGFREDPDSSFQIPPDLVVKCQAIDIVEVLFPLRWRRTIVETSCRHRKSRYEPLSPLQAHRSTTKSGGMWNFWRGGPKFRHDGVGHASNPQRRRANPLGRGLSALQQWIMQRIAEDGRVSYDRIYQEYFGWVRPVKHQPYRCFTPHHSYRTTIAPAEYNRVHATVCRTAKRLKQRGLVHLNGSVMYPPRESPGPEPNFAEMEAAIKRLSVNNEHRSNIIINQ